MITDTDSKTLKHFTNFADYKIKFMFADEKYVYAAI